MIHPLSPSPLLPLWISTERLVDPLTMRYFFRYEVEHLLARAGFEVDLFSDYDRSPLGAKDPGELLFVARKAM